MNILVLEARNEDTRLLDQSVARALTEFAGARVHALDPYHTYLQEGAAGLEAAILETVAREAVDVFIYCAFGMWLELDPEFVYRQLPQCYRIYIVGDDEGHFERYDRYNAQAYDLVMSANPLVERYHAYQVDAVYYPSVYSSRVYCRNEENLDKAHDVAFVGAMRGKAGREMYVRALEAAGITVTVHGFGAPAGALNEQQAVSLYRRARINLNFTGSAPSPLSPGETIMQRVRQVKGRCSKLALCGSFVLSEYAPGLERQFVPGREIDVFHDAQELVEKVRHYLAHEEEREAMAARAHARAMAEYDEACYWQRAADMIGEKARARRVHLPLCIDPPFWAVYGACRFKYLVIFAFWGRWRLAAEEMRRLWRAGRFAPRAALWFAAQGLHVARQRSRTAAAVAQLARWLRDLPGVRA